MQSSLEAHIRRLAIPCHYIHWTRRPNPDWMRTQPWSTNITLQTVALSGVTTAILVPILACLNPERQSYHRPWDIYCRSRRGFVQDWHGTHCRCRVQQARALLRTPHSLSNWPTPAWTNLSLVVSQLSATWSTNHLAHGQLTKSNLSKQSTCDKVASHYRRSGLSMVI